MPSGSSPRSYISKYPSYLSLRPLFCASGIPRCPQVLFEIPQHSFFSSNEKTSVSVTEGIIIAEWYHCYGMTSSGLGNTVYQSISDIYVYKWEHNVIKSFLPFSLSPCALFCFAATMIKIVRACDSETLHLGPIWVEEFLSQVRHSCLFQSWWGSYLNRGL